MDNSDQGDSDYNSKYGNRKDNKNNKKDEITIHIDKDRSQIYKNENNDKSTIKMRENSLNPFTATVNLWQNYFKMWSDTYNKIMSNSSPFTNKEFLFMYYRSDYKTSDK